MAKPPLLRLRSQQPVVAVVADVAAYRRLLTVGIPLQRLRKVTAAVTACARAFDRFSRRLLFFTASICKQTEPKTRAQTGSGVFGCKVNGIAFFFVGSGLYFEGLETDANSTHEEGGRVESDAIFHGKVVETGVLLNRSSFSVYLLHKHSQDRRRTTLVFCLVVKLGSMG